METAFTQMLQIGIIVRDVKKAVENYEELGIGPWKMEDIANDTEPFTDLKFDGKEITPKGIVLKGAFLQRYGMEIELLEPVAESAYKEWLDEKGPGLHHIAFTTSKPYETVLRDYKEKTGKEPWVRGTAIHGEMDYSYLDYREELGMIVECYSKPQQGKPYLEFDMESKRISL